VADGTCASQVAAGRFVYPLMLPGFNYMGLTTVVKYLNKLEIRKGWPTDSLDVAPFKERSNHGHANSQNAHSDDRDYQAPSSRVDGDPAPGTILEMSYVRVYPPR
jgi:hypothetical protein